MYDDMGLIAETITQEELRVVNRPRGIEGRFAFVQLAGIDS